MPANEGQNEVNEAKTRLIFLFERASKNEVLVWYIHRPHFNIIIQTIEIVVTYRDGTSEEIYLILRNISWRLDSFLYKQKIYTYNIKQSRLQLPPITKYLVLKVGCVVVLLTATSICNYNFYDTSAKLKAMALTRKEKPTML